MDNNSFNDINVSNYIASAFNNMQSHTSQVSGHYIIQLCCLIFISIDSR